VFGFLKTGQPDPSKAVRDVVAEYGWLGKDEIYHGLLTLRDRFFSFGAVPEHLQYMQNEYVDLMRNFSDRWRALEEAVGNVPSHVITQGSDVFSGGFFHLTQVNGFHKRKATQMVVEGDASEAGRWPGIGIRAAENAVVLADEKAAGYLQHRENCFVFEPEGVFIDPFQAALVTKVFWETFPASVRSDLIQHLQAHRING